MDGYHLYSAAQRLVVLLDALSNWYVRRSRSRFWAAAKDQDKWDAYHTLYEVLVGVSEVAAPFVPFISERIYQNLVRVPYPDAAESVHLRDWPTVDAAAIDEGLSVEMQAVRDIVSLGLQIRASNKLKVRQPLKLAEVILGHADLSERVEAYADLIADELNVKAVTFTQDAGDLVTYSVKPNYRALGPVFGRRMPVVRKALDGADAEEVRKALATEGMYRLTLPDGETVELSGDHVQVAVEASEGWAASGGPVGVVILDTHIDAELVAEGQAREVISRIQALRKQANLDYTARIRVRLAGDPAVLAACEAWRDTVAGETLADELAIGEVTAGAAHVSDIKVDKAALSVGLDVV